MAERRCGEVCPIGAASRRGGSTAETMATLQGVVSGLERLVCWGSGPTRHVSGERTVLVCFCPQGGVPQRFCMNPEQALQLAHELLCGLLTHNRELRALQVLVEELGRDGRPGGEGAPEGGGAEAP